MKGRFITSSIMIGIIILGMMNRWMFLAIILFLTVAALYEYFSLIKSKGIPIYSYTGLVIGSLIPLTIFFHFESLLGWELAFMVFALLTVFLMQFMRNDNKDAIIGISTTIFGVIYVSWLFSFLIKVRYMVPGVEGLKLLGFILIVTKSGDIGALFIGKSFGKHPLMPNVSPNKTIEGSIGSFIVSSLAAVACYNLLPPEFGFSVLHVAIMGFVIGGIGQIGDMSESLIKRDCNVKDSGRLLPSLGGVLDAIDSLLFSTPVFYYYLKSYLYVMH